MNSKCQEVGARLTRGGWHLLWLQIHRRDLKASGSTEIANERGTNWVYGRGNGSDCGFICYTLPLKCVKKKVTITNIMMYIHLSNAATFVPQNSCRFSVKLSWSKWWVLLRLGVLCWRCCATCTYVVMLLSRTNYHAMSCHQQTLQTTTMDTSISLDWFNAGMFSTWNMTSFQALNSDFQGHRNTP